MQSRPNGHYAVQDHLRSPIFVSTQILYVTYC